MVMDVLRALEFPNMDIRRKTVDMALQLTTPKNVEEIIMLLKKEVGRTQSALSGEGVDEYRQLLIGAIHASAVKFPEVASSVVHLMTDFLSDPNADTAEVFAGVLLFGTHSLFPCQGRDPLRARRDGGVPGAACR